ncbi:MAG: Flp pilus assembly complex ATPase component TadA, partial [Phycisphaerae bacterium]|nr:Flp pilus assembly complex ATPase component TadA [Phycisphaerae bacterium]
MAKSKKRLGEILVDWGLVEPSAITVGLEYASRNQMRLGEALVALGSVSEDDVAKALASQFDMEYRDLERHPIDPSAISLIPEDIIRRHFVLPVERRDSNLKVIITDPLDLETLDSLRFRLNVDLECSLAALSKVKAVVQAHFQDQQKDTLDGTISDLTQMGTQMSETLMGADIQSAGRLGMGEDESSAPIVKLVTAIISSGVQSRSSDIHIEPMADRVRVRYRIDGVCLERESIPKRMQNSVISRLKIMSGMDIATKRLPQDGRIKLTVGAEEIDFR